MLSLCNVVKKTNVMKKAKKDIVTKYEPPIKKSKDNEKEEKFLNINEVNYDEIANAMFENYKKKGEDIINEAYKKAILIEEEAYKKAYEKGFNEGQEKGYTEAYQKGYTENVEKAKAESEIIIDKANDVSKSMISSSKNQCMEYIEGKKSELKKLIYNIVKSTFKREIKNEEALNEMIIEALSNAKKSKSITIKCKDLYKDEIRKSTDLWKSQNVFNGDIFIIPDNSLKEGMALLEKDNGIIEIEIDKSLEKIKEILKS